MTSTKEQEEEKDGEEEEETASTLSSLNRGKRKYRYQKFARVGGTVHKSPVSGNTQTTLEVARPLYKWSAHTTTLIQVRIHSVGQTGRLLTLAHRCVVTDSLLNIIVS